MKKMAMLVVIFILVAQNDVVASLIQVSNGESPTGTFGPKLHNGQIAWGDPGANNIYFWDGNATQLIGRGIEPSLYGGTVAWSGGGIKYWDGSLVIDIVDSSHAWTFFRPSLYDGKIAFEGQSYGQDDEIFYWDGANIIRVTDNNTDDSWAFLFDGQITWASDGIIKYWDGNVTQNIGLGTKPSLYNGTIAWQSNFQQIQYWDGNSIINIGSGFEPSLYDGKIAFWDSIDDNGWEIYLWDGVSRRRLTNDYETDINPSLNNGQIAWARDLSGHAGTGYEIMLWDGGELGLTHVVPEPSTMLLLGAGLLGGVRLRRRQSASEQPAL